MRRREFVTLARRARRRGRLRARAQQAAMPVIGFLDAHSPEAVADRATRIPPGPQGDRLRRRRERGNRIPLRRESKRPAAGAGGRTSPPGGRGDRCDWRCSIGAFAAKAATAKIPIVFGIAEDPVGLGLVASLARPGGNSTGINFFIDRVGSKAAGDPACAGARSDACGGARQSGQSDATAATVRDLRGGYARDGAANPGRRTPEPAARSMRLSRLPCASGPTRSSSAPIAIFRRAGAPNWSNLASHHSVPATYSRRDFAKSAD